MLESDIFKKERLIDELILKPDSISGGITLGVSSSQNQGVVGGQFSKMKKFESHLTQNLKRRIKEMQSTITAKSEELDLVKKNIKTTKATELEVEMRAYVDECTRLRQQLEEVIRSKDTFADPHELKLIEDRFQQ